MKSFFVALFSAFTILTNSLFSYGDFISYELAQEIPEESITVSVKFLTGKTFEIECSSNTLVLELKKMVESATYMPAEKQLMIYQGKEMRDEFTLSQHNIDDGRIIYVRERR